MVRTLTERQLRIGQVFNALNFIGDKDNEVTEVITLSKHAKVIVATNNALLKAIKENEKRRYILGPRLPDCNSYDPIWEEEKETTPQHRSSRTIGHVRKLTTHWFQCATKARNEDIK